MWDIWGILVDRDLQMGLIFMPKEACRHNAQTLACEDRGADPVERERAICPTHWWYEAGIRLKTD